MPKILSPEQVAQYRRDGYVTPLRAFSAADAARYRAALEAEERRRGGRITGSLRSKSYLYLPFMDEIVRHPAILDAVEDLIGPDILVLHSATWIKEPGSLSYVSWHQDSTYFGLDPEIHVKAWLALAPSAPESGCVQVLPGTNRTGQLVHGFGERANNLLSQGQFVDVDLARTPPADLVLAPGEFSLHDALTVHGSGPNRSADRRIGIGVSYVPPQVRPHTPRRLSAMPVRGRDRFQHFDVEPRVDPAAPERGLAAHADAMSRYATARASAAAAEELVGGR